MSEPSSAGPEENVEIVRRRLRSLIRRYRAAAKLTQKEAATKLGFSESKLLRMEAGTQGVQPSDLRAMLQLYREADSAKIESLVAQAIYAQKARGYDEYAAIASREYQTLMGLEAGAQVISKFEDRFIPGLCQTEDYARHLSQSLSRDPDKVESQVELRMLRQRKLGLDEGEHPELDFIIGEAALTTVVGDTEVMNKQLDRLIEMNQDPSINLAVLPFVAGPHRSIGSAFTVLQFEDPELSDLLYLEGAGGESTSRDEKKDIDSYKDLFVELRELAEEYGPLETRIEEVRRLRYASSSEPVG